MRSVEASLSSAQTALPSSSSVTTPTVAPTATLDTSPAFDAATSLLAISPNTTGTTGDHYITTATATTELTTMTPEGDSVTTPAVIPAVIPATIPATIAGQEGETIVPPTAVNPSSIPASSSPVMESTPLSPEKHTTTTPTPTPTPTPLARSPATLPAGDPLRVSPAPPITNPSANANANANASAMGMVEAPLPGEEGVSGVRELKSVDSSKRKRNRRL